MIQENDEEKKLEAKQAAYLNETCLDWHLSDLQRMNSPDPAGGADFQRLYSLHTEFGRHLHQPGRNPWERYEGNG